ncbi:MAG: guanylate kinase [Clostridiales bacterium GWF2_38_85]|nr:MAG: guanylate kinase [Clostridiales bacterium GWF2_38_85]HBL84015.1 guanylate kinase [Clostridiales bacterium]
MEENKKGRLVVLSGPAGAGKGKVLEVLFSKRRDYKYSVSATTRNPRFGEKDGVNYFFITMEQFEKDIQAGNMLEYAEYCNNYYGTPKKYVDQQIEAGINVVLEIEVIGAMQIKKKYPSAVLIFLTPPDFKTLEERLRGRATESEEVIRNRLMRARDEIILASKYDYIITNYDNKENKAADDIISVVRAHRLRAIEQEDLSEKILKSI